MSSDSQLNGCLRPAFTESLVERLSTGACLALTSPHGQGRRRTLQDLRHALPASMRVLQANLRHCPQDQMQLLTTLAEQAGISDADNLERLLEQLPRQTLIILHNFDELQPGEASGFDARFFAALNGMDKHAGLALLCVCESIPPELQRSIEACSLPPLTGKEIANELALRGVAATSEQIESIAHSPAPYSAIEAIAAEGSA
jgi:hypothetical protein